jgi:hypothetical protein
VEMAGAERTGRWRMRKASTSAMVYLPELRKSSATSTSTVR